MKLHQAIVDHDRGERRFQAALHGMELTGGSGTGPGHISGRRVGAMARAKARRRGQGH